MAEQGLYTPEESKEVGWEGELVEQWPDLTVFDEVLGLPDRPQMIRWHRYLVEPSDDVERQMLNRLIERLKETCPGAKR